jgi:xanthine dehydrogenase accessory factor
VRHDVLILAADLLRREEPFVLATVVRREPASSSQSGDTAVITADGEFRGWLGGSCTQPTVLREARRALLDGEPRLIGLSPDPSTDPRPGVVLFPMTCHSGGSVEIYLEPVLPRPRLVLFGVSPIVRALARLAKAMDYAVHVADPAADRTAFPDVDQIWTDVRKLDAFPGRRALAVVATMSDADEEAIEAALAMEPAYLGVVASAKRFGPIRDALARRGVAAEDLAQIQTPAGLDIGARTPEEIAVSILAEIIERQRQERHAEVEPTLAEPTVAAARDVICGMSVEIPTARHTADYDGRIYYFCCGGCREKFLASPQRYTSAAGSGGGR